MNIETTPNGVTIHHGGQAIKIEPATLQEANRLAAAFRAAHRHMEKIEFVGRKSKKRASGAC